jgi:hypothetical protein
VVATGRHTKENLYLLNGVNGKKDKGMTAGGVKIVDRRSLCTQARIATGILHFWHRHENLKATPKHSTHPLVFSIEMANGSKPPTLRAVVRENKAERRLEPPANRESMPQSGRWRARFLRAVRETSGPLL